MLYGEQAANALNVLRSDTKLYKDYLSDAAIAAGTELVKTVDGLWEDVTGKIVKLLKEEIPGEFPHVFVWWYSVLLGIKKDAQVFQELVIGIRRHKEAFSPNTQHFLFYQLKSYAFRYPFLESFDTKKELWKYFIELTEGFERKLSCSLEPVPAEKRDSGLALVITEQFLAVQHGPTKTALDRCRALMVRMGKRVILMNTMEATSTLGKIPFKDYQQGNHPGEENKRLQSWKGIQIPYYQSDVPMPDIEKLEELLGEIRQMAPSIVIAIGGSSILANLVNKMVPVLSVGLCPSDFEYTSVKYQTLGRKLTREDKLLLQQVGYDETHVIESIFTSSLKPQTEHVTREEVHLPENGFLMVIVGTRLDEEVTDAFLEMVQGVLKDDMYLVFIGGFVNFEAYLDKFPKLRSQAVYLGYCDDILSRIEICNLYLNPTRRGGGTSCVEALFKGVPVVSVDFGDVAVNAGKDFCVNDYSEMAEKIKEYYENPEFYRQMSEKARRRAEVLLDTEKEFVRIVQEMQKREESGVKT